MKVGIYLAYGPSKKQSLINEGLGRYLAVIISSLLSSNNSIIIACPRWLVRAIEELFDDQGISTEKIEFLIPYSESIIYRIFFWAWSKKRKKKSRGRLAKIALTVIDRLIFGLVNIKNLILFIGLVLLGCLFVMLLLPIAAIMSIVAGLGLVILKIIKYGSNKTYNKIREKAISYYHSSYRVQRFLLQVREIIAFQEIKERVRKASANDLIKLINKLKDSVDIWYSPTAFFPEFGEIQAPKVLCMPDLVTEQFPYSFAAFGNNVTANIRSAIEKNDYFITYSEVIKQNVLMNKYSKTKEQIAVIPHIVNNMKDLIDVENFYKQKGYKGDANKEFSRQNMNKLYMHLINNQELYLTGEFVNKTFCFDNLEYILYPTQVRPNKNILTLLKAYLYLLREEYLPLKLILTGDVNHVPEVRRFIEENNLRNEILTFYNVDNQLLATLYERALLSVNSSLYEGGFPYTFGESLSVGTPIVMSDIPQVREVMDSYESELFLFDPFNHIDLAEKIKYGLNNRNRLLEIQTRIFEDLNKRTKEDLGKEYVSAFQYFIVLDKSRRRGKEKSE